MTPQHTLHRTRFQIARAAIGPARRFALPLALCCALLLGLARGAALAQSPTPTDAPSTHTVQRGETLSEIAKLHGFTLSQLMRVNGIPNPDAIYVGQELRFPIIDRPPGVTIHVVEPGEALSRIAQLYGVDLRTLMRANDMTNADGIVTGQELVIPGPAGDAATPEATPEASAEATRAATPAQEPTAEPTDAPTAEPTAPRANAPTTHTVRPGETISEIAKQYGVQLDDVLRINGIANANLIRSGTELIIPAPSLAETPASALSGEPEVEIIGEPEVEIVDTSTPTSFAGDATEGGAPATEATAAATDGAEADAEAESEAEPDSAAAVTEIATVVPLSERPAATLNRDYTVVSGDSTQRIALRLGIDIDALERLNNIGPDDGLRAGTTLLLPATDRDLRVVSEERQYVVAPGDSLSDIARGMGVKLGDLMTANRISNPNLISVGERLIVPGQTQYGSAPLQRVGPARSGYYYYTVQAGDTLGELTQDFDTTKLALMEYNNLTDEAVVYTGMELRVPYGAPPLPVRLPPVPISGSSFLVSLSRQQCWVFSGREIQYAWNCSTGHGQWRTRTGNFAVQSKIDNAKSNVWKLDMPWWLGIYDVGAVENGIHGLPVSWKTGRKIWTELIGQPATFGCAMLGDENAETLFNLAYIGMPVHIIQ